MTDRDGRTGGRPRAGEAIEFRMVLALTFAVFLVVATVGRLLPEGWRPLPQGDRGHRSILGEARQAAHACVPYAFMA